MFGLGPMWRQQWIGAPIERGTVILVVSAVRPFEIVGQRLARKSDASHGNYREKGIAAYRGRRYSV